MANYDRELQIKNPDLKGGEVSYLTSRVAAAGTALTVANNEGVATDDILVVGVPGDENTESRPVASITNSNTITLDSPGVRFSHAINTPLYRTKWDQIQVQRKASGGSFANITGSPFNIEWDESDGFTKIDISTGFDPSDTYQWQFVCSATSAVSGYADPMVGTGLSRNSVGYALTQIKKNPVAKNIPDQDIVEYFNDLHDEEYENSPEAWYLYKQGTAIPTVAGQDAYAFPTDFGRMKFLLYDYTTSSERWPLNPITEHEMRVRKIDQDPTDDDIVLEWAEYPPDDDSARGYFAVWPTPETDDHNFYPVYFQELTAVDSYGDELVIPKIKIYVDYALYRIYDDIEEDDTNARKFEGRVRSGFGQLKKRQHREVGSKEFMKFRGTHGSKQIFTTRGGTGQQQKELYW